eukprot:TRINITY_DN2029_c0_g2_i1.p2 TRINITY_DN2029_c0_g2~~TRINITY_DN2029_c0_g2_i1.p2  ORF type:complete len:157 (-),score=30.44 TRINITY_DN2029_c0_g2_i1:63-533(-)
MGPKEIANLRPEPDRRNEAPQTPAETGNYEQRVLDHIVQTAIKDFIDIAQTSDVQDADESDYQEKSELYGQQLKSAASRTAIPELKDGLSNPSGEAVRILEQRSANTEEASMIEQIAQELGAAFDSMGVEDKGGLLVTFSASLSASRGSPAFNMRS